MSCSLLLSSVLFAQYAFPDDLVTGKQLVMTAAYEDFKQDVFFYGGGKKVKVSRTDRDPGSPTWYDSDGEYTLSMKIVDVTFTHGGDVLYVHGANDDGTFVVERWTFDVPVGRWQHIPTVPALPTGYSGVTEIKGDTYIPPLPNRPWVSPTREVVVRPNQLTAIGELRQIEADPEGRFLLGIQHSTGSIWKIDLGTTPSTLTTLYAAGTTPNLYDMRTMVVCESAGDRDRVYILYDYASDLSIMAKNRVAITDTDNDGVFESVVEYDQAQWQSSGLPNNELIGKEFLGVFTPP